LTGTEGKLSKRLGSLGVAELREQGIEAEAIISLLARLGTSDPVDASLSVEQLCEAFDLSRFGRAPARFDEAELARLNARSSTACPMPRLPTVCPPGWARKHGKRSAPT
jgi:glutamyl-tRNA synthetase